MSWVGFCAGLVLAIATWASVLGSLVITRAAFPRLERHVVMWLRRCYLVVVRRMPTVSRRDRTLASLAPTALFTLLAIWLALFLLAYALLVWPFVDDLPGAIRASGSSIFTLGIAGPSGFAPTVFVLLSAATGIIVIALFIAYLPTLYGRFNAREAAVIRLTARSDPPPWGPRLLGDQVRRDLLPTLPMVYTRWEELVAQISVSTVHYPLLAWFRGPYPATSWLASLVAALDSAALYQALAPSRAPAECRSFLRLGEVALSHVRHPFLVGTLDPATRQPLGALSDEAYDEGLAELRAAGFEIEVDEQAGRDAFRALRAGYGQTAYALAELVLAPPAPWLLTTSAFDNLPEEEIR